MTLEEPDTVVRALDFHLRRVREALCVIGCTLQGVPIRKRCHASGLCTTRRPVSTNQSLCTGYFRLERKPRKGAIPHYASHPNIRRSQSECGPKTVCSGPTSSDSSFVKTQTTLLSYSCQILPRRLYSNCTNASACWPLTRSATSRHLHFFWLTPSMQTLLEVFLARVTCALSSLVPHTPYHPTSP